MTRDTQAYKSKDKVLFLINKTLHNYILTSFNTGICLQVGIHLSNLFQSNLLYLVILLTIMIRYIVKKISFQYLVL